MQLKRLRLTYAVTILAVSTSSCWAQDNWWDQLEPRLLPDANEPVHEVIDRTIDAKLTEPVSAQRRLRRI